MGEHDSACYSVNREGNSQTLPGTVQGALKYTLHKAHPHLSSDSLENTHLDEILVVLAGLFGLLRSVAFSRGRSALCIPAHGERIRMGL